MLRVGLVGAGGWGRKHAEELKGIEQAELVAVSGGRRAAEAAREFDARHVEDPLDLCRSDEVDAVIIASPHHVHCEQTAAALEAGKAALVEKPMALTIEDCDEMIRTARRTKGVLMVAQTMRYEAVDRATREFLRSGELGKILMVRSYRSACGPDLNDLPQGAMEWYRDPERSVGMFLGFGIHAIDKVLAFMGSEPVEVTARGGSRFVDVDVETITMGMADFEDGAVLQFWHQEAGPRGMRRPYFRDLDGIEILCEGGLAVSKSWVHVSCRRPADNEWKTVCKYPLEQTDPVRAQDGDFVRAALGEIPVPITGEDGRRAVAVCRGADVSRETGRPFRIPPLEV